MARAAKSSLVLKWLFVALLALSLAGKAVWSRPPPEPDPRISIAAIDEALRTAGFDTRILEQPRSPGILVQAARGSCRLFAGDYPVGGTLRDVYRQLAAGIGPLRFVYQGGVQETEPKLSSLVRFHLWRALHRGGIATRRAPLIAVIASGGCDLDRIPWEMTASVPG
jgi:hypothetical protein